MKPEWTVCGALEELVGAIQAGSLLEIPADVQYSLKERYKLDFQQQWDDGANWNVEKKEILPLANMVGALATTLTIFKSIKGGVDGPLVVDEKSAHEAGFFIAQVKPCPVVPTGVWCDDYVKSFKEEEQPRAEVVAALRSFLRGMEVI